MIRDYAAFDFNEIMNLYTSVGWTNYTDHPQMLEKAYKNSLCTLGAYTAQGRLVGIIRAVGDGASILFIQDIIVLPEFQRKGIGTDLLRAIIRRYPDVYQTELMTDNTDKTIAFISRLVLRLRLNLAALGS
ncbi:MAG: GNAT family N-acetyltransferase [Oscillospiraceae bacterium]